MSQTGNVLEVWASSVTLSITLRAFQVVILWYNPFAVGYLPSLCSPFWQQLTSVVSFLPLVCGQVPESMCSGQVPQGAGEKSKTLDSTLCIRGHPSLLIVKIGQKYSKNRPLSWVHTSLIWYTSSCLRPELSENLEGKVKRNFGAQRRGD